jgi:hypothetical protein
MCYNSLKRQGEEGDTKDEEEWDLHTFRLKALNLAIYRQCKTEKVLTLICNSYSYLKPSVSDIVLKLNNPGFKRLSDIVHLLMTDLSVTVIMTFLPTQSITLWFTFCENFHFYLFLLPTVMFRMTLLTLKTVNFLYEFWPFSLIVRKHEILHDLLFICSFCNMNFYHLCAMWLFFGRK